MKVMLSSCHFDDVLNSHLVQHDHNQGVSSRCYIGITRIINALDTFCYLDNCSSLHTTIIVERLELIKPLENIIAYKT
jgi:hypothetical protein